MHRPNLSTGVGPGVCSYKASESAKNSDAITSRGEVIHRLITGPSAKLLTGSFTTAACKGGWPESPWLHRCSLRVRSTSPREIPCDISRGHRARARCSSVTLGGISRRKHSTGGIVQRFTGPALHPCRCLVRLFSRALAFGPDTYSPPPGTCPWARPKRRLGGSTASDRESIPKLPRIQQLREIPCLFFSLDGGAKDRSPSCSRHIAATPDRVAIDARHLRRYPAFPEVKTIFYQRCQPCTNINSKSLGASGRRVPQGRKVRGSRGGSLEICPSTRAMG